VLLVTVYKQRLEFLNADSKTGAMDPKVTGTGRTRGAAYGMLKTANLAEIRYFGLLNYNQNLSIRPYQPNGRVVGIQMSPLIKNSLFSLSAKCYHVCLNQFSIFCTDFPVKKWISET